jgi:antagonist of KipI
MNLIVRETGVHSILVERGRTGSRSLGVPVGGAADRRALALGNGLVGNPPDTCALEITLVGPTLESLRPTACVVFGAPFPTTINGSPVSFGTTFTLEAGDVLRLGATPTHARGYLCIAGGFDAKVVLGSRSALEPIRKGDVLSGAAARIAARALPFHTSSGENAVVTQPHSLRVLPGPQHDWFSDDVFFTEHYEVTASSNRMGLRLKGEPVKRRPGELISEAVAPGTIQIANDGLPIVLGVDGQTIGGYPKIAQVIRADLDGLAQLRPGERVRFFPVTARQADLAAVAARVFLKQWLRRLESADRQPEFLASFNSDS